MTGSLITTVHVDTSTSWGSMLCLAKHLLAHEAARRLCMCYVLST
jgi:hypothetical protein